jgi:hypothetical protein
VLRLIADDRCKFFADKDYGALETLDAIWHGLDGMVGHTYMQHGLTPHQGFLIHNSPAASLNMWGTDRDIERVHGLLGASLPPDVIAGILLDADSPEEAEALINHYAGTAPDDPAKYNAAMERINTLFDTDNYRRVVGCDCLRREGKPHPKP